MKKNKLYWRINERITVDKVRVLDEKGKLIGILKTEEAIKTAREKKLTLVEIAPKAKPPVAKIVDFGKFRYQEGKKQRKEAQKSKGSELKEIRFSPFIAENDYNTRLVRVKEFLGNKDKVKIVVVFKGRHMGKKPFGYQLLEKILKELGDQVSIDMEPKFLGRHLTMIVSPLVKVKKEKENAKTKN